MKNEIKVLIFQPPDAASHEYFNQLFPDHLFINGDIRENLTNTYKKAIIVGNFMKSGNFNSKYIIHGYDEFQPSPFKPEIDHS